MWSRIDTEWCSAIPLCKTPGYWTVLRFCLDKTMCIIQNVVAVIFYICDVHVNVPRSTYPLSIIDFICYKFISGESVTIREEGGRIQGFPDDDLQLTCTIYGADYDGITTNIQWMKSQGEDGDGKSMWMQVRVDVQGFTWGWG